MALDVQILDKLILSNLKKAGIGVDNEYSKVSLLTNAIADAVVTHIKTAQVKVTVAGGSSSGVHSGVVL